MAKQLGVSVLHPGGFSSTKELAKKCGLNRASLILDVGCGKGSSSLFLAKHYGCRMVGVDLDQNLLLQALKAAERRGALGQVVFRQADIHELPFEDNSFDAAIIQAVLIFTEKPKVLKQVVRKLRPGGCIGVVEIAWKKPPTSEVLNAVRNTLCDVAVNAEIHEDWIELLQRSGLSGVEGELRDMEFSFRGMVRDEGLPSSLRIALKSIFDEASHRKTDEIRRLFREMHEYLGYGLYVGWKR
jgi:SAM-dependent methyltransferase